MYQAIPGTRSTTYLLMEPYSIPEFVMCIWNELKIDQATTRCSHRHHQTSGYFLMRWYIRWMTCLESMTKILVVVVKGGCSVKVTGLIFSGVSSANFSVVIGGTDAGRTEITSNASIPEARLADFLHDVCCFRHCVLLNAQWPKTTF